VYYFKFTTLISRTVKSFIGTLLFSERHIT